MKEVDNCMCNVFIVVLNIIGVFLFNDNDAYTKYSLLFSVGFTMLSISMYLFTSCVIGESIFYDFIIKILNGLIIAALAFRTHEPNGKILWVMPAAKISADVFFVFYRETSETIKILHICESSLDQEETLISA